MRCVLLSQYSIFGSVKDIFKVFQTFIAQTKNSKCTKYGKVSVSEGKTRWNAAGCYYHSWSSESGSQETLEEADHCDQRKGGGGEDTQAHRGGGGGRSQGKRLEDLAPDPPVAGA